jgi:hypothetical protein
LIDDVVDMLWSNECEIVSLNEIIKWFIEFVLEVDLIDNRVVEIPNVLTFFDDLGLVCSQE